MAELVELGLFVGIREDIVGTLDFLELGLGRLVAGVGVGVMLAREGSVCLFDLVGRGVAGHPKHLVIVAVGHRSSGSVASSSAPGPAGIQGGRLDLLSLAIFPIPRQGTRVGLVVVVSNG